MCEKCGCDNAEPKATASKQGVIGEAHDHDHVHADGTVHRHTHDHSEGHTHNHVHSPASSAVAGPEAGAGSKG